jgi:hypothetical protein
MGKTLKFRVKLILGAVMALTSACDLTSATELAVLRNGSTIRCERREGVGNEVRLYIADAPGSYVEVAAGDIAGFEKDDRMPPRVEMSTGTAGQTTHVPATLDDIIQDASRRNNVDKELIRSVIRTESDFRVDAVSPKGARGLMQLMPETASQLGIVDIFDPAENVDGGTRYLRQLLDRFGGNIARALAAYNAGPERVEQYKGVPPFVETRMYVSRVTADLKNKKKVAAVAKQVLAGHRIALEVEPVPTSESGELIAEARAAENSGH